MTSFIASAVLNYLEFPGYTFLLHLALISLNYLILSPQILSVYHFTENTEIIRSIVWFHVLVWLPAFINELSIFLPKVIFSTYIFNLIPLLSMLEHLFCSSSHWLLNHQLSIFYWISCAFIFLILRKSFDTTFTPICFSSPCTKTSLNNCLH